MGGKSLFLSQLGLVAALLVLMMAPGSSADLVGDACTIDSDCTLNAFCDNLVCACLDNFEADANNHCVDTDECMAETDDCTAANSYCVNEYGSFRCDCMPGYTGDGDVACFNLNECLEPGMNPCSDMAMCYDMDGSYRCECKEGYEGNGYVCTDIDECMTSDAPSCGINAMCVNTPGSAGCECMLGYRGDPETLCEDVDECAWGLDECDKHAMCTNVLGSYECKCMDGYYGDGKMCKDHENPGDLHEADYIHDYPDELGAQHADHDHDELEMALPKIPTEGFEHYHEYYCPLNDDDCGWKPDRSREFCWKIFPHAIHDYHEAYYDCMARSIKGCPARLLPVKDLSAVYYSMTREDVEYCPQELRVDGTVEYDEATGEITYVDGEKMNVKIPMGWTEKPGLADFTNTLEGSLTANLDKKTLIGSVPVEGFFLPMVCQSCVVEIPECPALCDRCNEATTTNNPTSTVTPHFDCNNLDGDMLMTVLGGKDLRTEETLESWRVFDDRYNWCDAQEQFGFFGHGTYADVPAFFRLDQPRYDFGYTSEYNPKRGDFSGLYAYIVIAGGVVTDMETGMEKVTNEVAARYDSSDDNDYNYYHLSRKVEDGKYGAFNDEQYTDSEGNNHTLAVVMDPMVVPRAEFALLGMNAATDEDRSFDYNDYDDEHVIWNLVMAYGGRIDMDGTLTDSIEYRNYDETDRDPSDGAPIGDNPKDYDYYENAQLKDDNPNRWVKSTFRLPVPSRTMGVKVHDSLINNPDESTLFNGIREVHMVALVDTSPVQFVTYQMDFRTYQEPRPYDQFRLPELQLDAGELAGFVQSDTYFGVDGPQHLFMAIDTETTTVYTYDFVNNQTWIRHEDAIPEGLTARHLIDTTYYLLQSHHSAVSLLGYSEDEQLSLVKFWQNDTQIFGDNYIEYRLDTTPGANNPELVPFPVKLDLPPMRGAAFGLDATDVGWRRFTTDLNDLFIDPLDDSSLVARSQNVGASLHTRTKPAAHDSEYVAQAKYHELLRLRHATVDRLHKAVEAKAAEVMTKRMAGMEMDLKLA